MSKPKRKGVFIGAFVPQYIKEELQRRAKAKRGSSLSQELTNVLKGSIKGPAGETPEKRYSSRYDRSWQTGGKLQTQAELTTEAGAILERLDKTDVE